MQISGIKREAQVAGFDVFPNNDSHRIYYNVTNIELNRIVKFYSLNQVLVLLCNLNRSSFFDEDIRFRRQDPTSVQGEWFVLLRKRFECFVSPNKYESLL